MEGIFIHSTSIIDQNVSIGKFTKIWHFCHISDSAKIGEECILGQNVYIGKNVSIGNKVKIQNNVSVYEKVTIEDEVFCGPSVVFTNVINPRSNVDRKSEFKETIIKRGATLGANSTIICGVLINEFAFIGAGAVVTTDIPAYSLYVGNPAKQLDWVCRCGERLNLPISGTLMSQCKFCKSQYTLKEKILNLEKSGG